MIHCSVKSFYNPSIPEGKVDIKISKMKQVFKSKSLKLSLALFVLFLVLRLTDIYLCLVISTRVGRVRRKSKWFRLSWSIVKQWVLTVIYAVIIPTSERFIWALILMRCFYWSIFFCFSLSLHRSFISTTDNHQKDAKIIVFIVS